MQITLSELNTCYRAAFVTALGHIFERSPWVAEETCNRRPFRDAAHLHAEFCAAVRRAIPQRQLALIRAHPDLAGRLAVAGQLTRESTGEQASAGLDRLSPEESAEFQRLNAEYHQRFGFPFIICARLNDKQAILDSLRSRLENTPSQEHDRALEEIEKIAWLRLQDILIRAP